MDEGQNVFIPQVVTGALRNQAGITLGDGDRGKCSFLHVVAYSGKSPENMSDIGLNGK